MATFKISVDAVQAAYQGSAEAGEKGKGEEEGGERAAQLVSKAVGQVDQCQQQLLLIRGKDG